MKNAPLTVFYENIPVGTISRGSNADIIFQYDGKWKREGFPISISLGFSLSPKELSRNANSFFRNMMPDGMNLNIMCRNAKVDKSDTFGFLSAYGKECAGAISVYASNMAPVCESYRKVIDVTDKIAAYMDSRLPGQPTNIQVFLRDSFSLPGAQDKFQCIVQNGRLYFPEKGSGILPSHIVKPDSSFAANEYFCTKLAERIGLPVHRSQLIHLGSSYGAAFERYDRFSGKRLHQEDMCQALGRPDFQKYEQMAGGITFSDIAGIMKEHLPESDRESLVSVSIFNILIGNGDAHAKNFSFLYNLDGSISLAPFYDIASSTVEDLDDGFAMKIGNAETPNDLSSGNLSLFALDMELPGESVYRICDDVHSSVGRELGRFLDEMQGRHPEYGSYFLRIAETIIDKMRMFEPILSDFARDIQSDGIEPQM